MFIYTFQIILISLILIILAHYLYIFFKDTLTIPKTNDLVNSKQYQEIIDIIKNKQYVNTNDNNISNYDNNNNNNTNNNNNNNTNTNNINNTNNNNQLKIDKTEMKNELKNFLKNMDTEKQNNNNNIENPLETNPFSSNAYTSYM